MTHAPAADVRPTARSLGPRLSDETLIALGPRRAYETLVAARAHGSWQQVAARAAFVLIVFATAATVMATRVVSVPTLLTVAMCWVFVPAIQLIAGFALCRHPPETRVSLPRAVELLFLAHVPWSVWLLAAGLAAVWIPSGVILVNLIYVTALVPIVWTPRLIAAFCRSVLGCTAAQARLRTIAHQAFTWAIIAGYIILSIQPWARFGGAS